VCYYHNMQKSTKFAQINKSKAASTFSGSSLGGGVQILGGGAADRRPSDVSIVERRPAPKQQPKPQAPTRSLAGRSGMAGWASDLSASLFGSAAKGGGGTPRAASEPPRKDAAAAAAAASQAAAPSTRGGHAQPRRVGDGDKAVLKLLSGAPKRSGANGASASASAKEAANFAGKQSERRDVTGPTPSRSAPWGGQRGESLSQTPSHAAAAGGSSALVHPTAADPPPGALPGVAPPAAAGFVPPPTAEEIANRAAIALILKRFPNGIPEPGTKGAARSRIAWEDDLQEDALKAARSMQGGGSNIPAAKKRSKKRLAAMGLEEPPAALQADPRKDSVRLMRSRFASLADQEREAKRHRALAEFEAQDAALEQMEAVMSANVVAWKCAECCATTDNGGRKSDCEAKQHSLTKVSASLTKWECIYCKEVIRVLDRSLPTGCVKCGSKGWKQIPLQGKPRTAPMEREMLLPRGEELPYLNSIPGMPSRKRDREAADPYDAL